MNVAILAAALLSAWHQAAASPPVPVKPLHTLIAADDYPVEAIRRKEQGSVRFKLDIGSDGEVTNCSILESSGSQSLDDAACRIMAARATFTPAKDESGRPTAGFVESTIRWSFGEDMPGMQRVNAATSLWINCTLGEASRLATSSLGPGEVIDKAYEHCAGVEQFLELEMRRGAVPGLDSRAIEGLKQQYRSRITANLEEVRKLLHDTVTQK